MASLAAIRVMEEGRMCNWEMGRDFAIISWKSGPPVAIPMYSFPYPNRGYGLRNRAYFLAPLGEAPKWGHKQGIHSRD